MEYNIPSCFYRISIKALILNEEKKFLLVKNENSIWEYPGGGIDSGETIEDCLMRELHEEFGARVQKVAQNPSYLIRGVHSEKGYPFADIVYQVKVEKIPEFTPSDECIELGYFSREEAEKLELYPNVREFLKVYNPTNHGNL